MQFVSSLFRYGLLAAGLCAAPAFADNTFTAQFSNFSYTLTDLDPTDAYTPTGPQFAEGYGAGSLWLLGFNPDAEVDRDTSLPLGGAGADAGQAGSHAGSWSLESNLGHSLSVTTSGYGLGSVDVGFGIPITLQPNTALTITGHLTLDWTQTGTELPDTSSSMSSIFRIGDFVYGFNEVVYILDRPDSIDTDLSVTYIYTGLTPREVGITADLYAHSSIFPPVPEPSTYAMLGAGLLVVGATARRRQRRQ